MNILRVYGQDLLNAHSLDIVANVLRNRDVVFQRINPKKLEQYDLLQNRLQLCDVSSDREYQRTFNSFYVVQRRPQQWYAGFYGLLQREKNNKQITFEAVLRELYVILGRVETSFASKLVATIRPEAPVYDAFVRRNLQLQVPPQHRKPDDRIKGYIDVYARMEEIYSCTLEQPNFRVLREELDRYFPSFVHFTDLKKLDLMLWQLRVE